MNVQRPSVLVTRAVFPAVIDRLRAHFTVVDNPEDADWSRAELVNRLRGQAGVLTAAGERIDAELLAACPALRICANMAVGYNNFDLSAMTRAGVLATNTPDVLTETTADFGLALLLATARRIGEAERYLRSGAWQRWRYDLFLGAEVHGRTLGILGMGRIGQAIARRARHGFGMQVLYANRSRLDLSTELACGARWVGRDELLAQADHLIVVVPYSAQAHHLVGEAQLARMKPSATLVNIARGGVVDDAALARALAQGRLAAAGLDVFEGEPQVLPALLALPNVVLTPHIASASLDTRLAMANLAADNLIDFLTQGRARTPLNPEVLAH